MPDASAGYPEFKVEQAGPLDIREAPDASCHPLQQPPLIGRKGCQRPVETVAIERDLITRRKITVPLAMIAKGALAPITNVLHDVGGLS